MSRQVLPTAPSPTITHWGEERLKNGVIVLHTFIFSVSILMMNCRPSLARTGDMLFKNNTVHNRYTFLCQSKIVPLKLDKYDSKEEAMHKS